MEDQEEWWTVVFSQALSPNSDLLKNKINAAKTIWISSITLDSTRTDRLNRRKAWEAQGARFITYKEEEPDDTLVRIQGPVAGFLASFYFRSSLNGLKMSFSPRHLKPSEALIEEFIRSKQIMFVVDSDLLPLLGNLAMKFLEGCFSRPPIFCDQLNFSHGYFQYALDQRIPVVTVGQVHKELTKLVDSSCFSERIESFGAMAVLELELYGNFLMIPFIEHYQVNQLNWKGKQLQRALYELTVLPFE